MPKRHISGLHILLPFRNNRKGTAYLNKAGGGVEGQKERSNIYLRKTMLSQKSPAVFLTHMSHRPLLAFPRGLEMRSF